MKVWWIIPFVGILLSIALFPLLTPHFWHNHYGKVSLFWGVIFFISFTIGYGIDTSFYYLIRTYINEYIPFICLLLALFTVSGGIRLNGNLVGTPLVNVIILLIGTALASFMGTTGAAMLLIRPMIRSNSWRKKNAHIIVFFIFLVANIGGSLTPLGDPPLFLGYLRGVDFTWTLVHMFPITLFTTGILIVIFFIIDTYYYNKETNKPVKSANDEKISISGKRNFLFFPFVIGAVIFSSAKLGNAFTFYYVDVPWSRLGQTIFFLIITYASLKITPKEIRTSNEFNWEPVLEVSKLFATIFITMIPPILMLKAGASSDPLGAGSLGFIIKGVFDGNGQPINANFFWATGVLSAFLDNAPTYVVFFEAAGNDAIKLMSSQSTLKAISIGAVFMGACSYIGNAPNFMTKTIAEQSGIKMPTFFGYILKYSIPILVPVLILLTFLFI
jgi:Na+/H+ antiporter NhaD/arsenite permease-like protein